MKKKNDKSKRIRIYLPIAAILLFLIDAQITRALQLVGKESFLIHAHLLLIVLMMASFRMKRKTMIFWGIVLGLLMDLYYIGIIGIYTIAMPLTVAATYLLFSYVEANSFTLLINTIIIISIFEVSTAGLQVLFNISNISGVVFFARMLGPTLLFNIGMFLLLIAPLRKLFKLGPLRVKE
ncbi:rod shape-determining protein MreD [Enterococcus hirae]|jgi:rod shape-determining protein MreD|nr:rod shape-determining protein MreD [Enterococcaceae bacterium]MCI1920148.1 rod shape-determining protein MreD [Enterococcaceae bacterium]MDM8212568.1 rod shape-determining protein MreD [Enterococcus hirae]